MQAFEWDEHLIVVFHVMPVVSRLGRWPSSPARTLRVDR
jgi:hypothetical protein